MLYQLHCFDFPVVQGPIYSASTPLFWLMLSHIPADETATDRVQMQYDGLIMCLKKKSQSSSKHIGTHFLLNFFISNLALLGSKRLQRTSTDITTP